MVDAIHLTMEQIDGYRRRSMTPSELLTADDHLAVCATCREELAKAEPHQATVDSFRASLERDTGAEPMHLSHSDLAGHLDGTLDEIQGEIVESHLELCSDCKKDMLDLEAFRDSLTAESRQESPGALRRLWHRIVSPFIFLVEPVPLRVAAGIAAAALLFWAGSLPFRSRVAELKAQLAELQREEDRLRRDNEAASKTAFELQAQLSRLQSAQSLEPGPGAPFVLALNDSGGRVALDREGNVTGMGVLSPEHQKTLRIALGQQKLPIPRWIGEITARTGVLLGGDDEAVPFALLSPVATAVWSERPKFRWQPLRGATEYEVALYDGDYNRIAASPLLHATEWTPPKGLGRGRTYIWRVKAIRNGETILSPKPPAPEARFRVMQKDTAEELVHSLQAYSKSHLMLGVLYAQAGALEDAEHELQELVKLNPQSNAAKKLLQSAQLARRQ